MVILGVFGCSYVRWVWFSLVGVVFVCRCGACLMNMVIVRGCGYHW